MKKDPEQDDVTNRTLTTQQSIEEDKFKILKEMSDEDRKDVYEFAIKRSDEIVNKNSDRFAGIHILGADFSHTAGKTVETATAFHNPTLGSIEFQVKQYGIEKDVRAYFVIKIPPEEFISKLVSLLEQNRTKIKGAASIDVYIDNEKLKIELRDFWTEVVEVEEEDG